MIATVTVSFFVYCNLQARDTLKILWENEAHLCSFISDIQQEQFCTSENRMGYSMFFLETILVPPIKFRPAAKGGDSVSVCHRVACDYPGISVNTRLLFIL